MSEANNFSELAATLSVEERRELLKKLAVKSNITNEPLYTEKVRLSQSNIEAQYQKLPWYYHLLLLIISFFKSKPPVKVFEDRLINKIGQEIESKHHGYFDYRQNLLLPLFHKQLTELKDSVRFFKDALEVSVQKDRGAFYAFLGSLEMPDVHKRLMDETLPLNISEKHTGVNQTAMKQLALEAMENAFAAINEDNRKIMYNNAHSLYCLKELAFYLFDRVLYAFSSDTAVKGLSCSASVVREQLATLNDILYSMKEPPSMELLGSLFVFMLQEEAKENASINIEEECKDLIAKAEDSIINIRQFNSQIPLTSILRFANRDTSINPKDIGGGEDWFTIYRDYWKQYIDDLFGEYEKTCFKQELFETFKVFLKGGNITLIENAQTDSDPNGFPVPKLYVLSFLLAFYKHIVISELNKVLRPIMLDGQFSKRENRTLFTESYNDLMKIEHDIQMFEAKIAPTGELGKQYEAAQTDMSVTSRRRKIQNIQDAADELADTIVSNSRNAIQNLLTVLQAIENHDSEGRNDMLVNTSKFIGKAPLEILGTNNAPPVPAALTPKGLAFFNGIKDAINTLKQSSQIMDNIDTMGSL